MYLRIYLCIHVSIYVLTYLSMYSRIYLCTHVSIYVLAYLSMYSRIYLCTYVKKKTPKRPNIEVSMDSSSDLTIELTNFQNDLDIIKDSLEGVVKKKQIFTNLLMTL